MRIGDLENDVENDVENSNGSNVKAESEAEAWNRSDAKIRWLLLFEM